LILKDAAGIVTGASRGLGLKLYNRLLEEGCKLLPNQANLCRRDLSISRNAYLYVVEALRQFKKIDFLINNAGYAHLRNPIELIEESDVEQTFRSNVFATINMMKHVIPIMKSQKSGVIINIASNCAIKGRAVPGLAPYCASKAAILQLTEAVAKELQNTNIKVISVSPGGMNTDMRRKIYGEEDAKRQMDPADVAEYIVNIMKNIEYVPNGHNFIITKDFRETISCGDRAIYNR